KVLKISPLKRLVSVVPETTLDLLNVYRVVEAGDLVYSLTSRELKKERRDGSVDSVRVTVELGVELLEKRLDPMVKRVDLHGVIRYESKELGLVGKHHSIHLGVGDEITVESRKNYPRLEAMAKYYRANTMGKETALILVDDESIAVYAAGPPGMKQVYRRTFTEGKREPEERAKAVKKAYGEAVEKIGEKVDVYVFGPSVLVDEFASFVKREKPDFLNRVKRTGFVSATDSAGVSELLRSGALHELREMVKAVADMEEVEELMKTLATEPSKAAVGFREVANALRMRAVEKLLAAEEYLWNHLENPDVSSMIEGAETSAAVVRVISTGTEASEKLVSLGGVAALLRYPVEPSILKNTEPT
ncbi:MAG: hypothetical protein NZ956_00360, partial [Candidatus Caldarchaeum sp.]|nr:hypothetical protein [Candidatus Caldarchaeum sp.]